jgi:Spy/CpxP family protein refolding chaperone
MTTPTDTPTDANTDANTDTPSRGRRGRGRKFAAVLFLGGVVGLGATAAMAAGQGDGTGWRGSHGWHHSAMTVEQVHDQAANGADRVLDYVDATDEQRADVQAIVQDAVPDGMALRQQGRGLKAELHDALLAEQVEADEVEGIRQDGLALADRATALGMDVLVDLAQVLTLEQREQLADRARSFHR